LRAYLAFYRTWWNALLPAGEHEHEVGEDTAGCYNCRLAALGGAMSAFEVACWGWYVGNVNAFAMEAGIVGEMFRGLDLKGKLKSMFLGALNEIHETFAAIRADKLRQMKELGQVNLGR
jgi:hypothetical protein